MYILIIQTMQQTHTPSLIQWRRNGGGGGGGRGLEPPIISDGAPHIFWSPKFFSLYQKVFCAGN